MKLTKKVLSNSVAAVVLATAGLAVSTTASAAPEVSASAAVASTYLWRGYDLGSGTPAVSGDLSVSMGGAYAGIWGSSGDTAVGSEYDLYAGYGMEIGGLTIDLSVWNYNYPTGPSEIDTADLSEVILSLGYGPFSFAYYDNVAGGSGYEYYTLGASFGQFAVNVGKHDNVVGDDPVHVDLSYAYNDNLSFTVSQFVADESDDDDLKFVVSYSIPIAE